MIHQQAVKCSNCLASFNFLVSVSPLHLLRNFPSFLRSCLNTHRLSPLSLLSQEQALALRQAPCLPAP